MADQAINIFTSYIFTEQEEQIANILSPQNIQMLCNLRAEAATKQLSIALPTTDAERKQYEYDIMYHQARIIFVNELLAHHESALQYLQDARAQQMQPATPYDGSIYSAFTNSNQEQ